MLERVHFQLAKVGNSGLGATENDLNSRRSLSRLSEILRSIAAPFSSSHRANPTTNSRDQLAELVCTRLVVFLSCGRIYGELIGNLWGVVHERADGNGLLDGEFLASDERCLSRSF